MRFIIIMIKFISCTVKDSWHQIFFFIHVFITYLIFSISSIQKIYLDVKFFSSEGPKTAKKVKRAQKTQFALVDKLRLFSGVRYGIRTQLQRKRSVCARLACFCFRLRVPIFSSAERRRFACGKKRKSRGLLVLSARKQKSHLTMTFLFWRRQRDSNPRGIAPKRFSRPPRYDRFDMPPYS